MQITGAILSSLAVIIVSLELFISSQFWNIVIHDGLQGKSTFLFFTDFDSNISTFHNDILSFLPIVFLLCAIYFALYLMVSEKPAIMQLFYKGLTGIVIFFLSELFLNKLSFIVQYASSSIIDLSPHWVYYFTDSYMISNIHYFAQSGNSIMEIILDGIYVSSAVSILFFLMARVAILVILYLLLPVFTPLYVIGYLRNYIVRFWILYLQLILSPLLILSVIYLYINFNGDFFVQMGFLLLLTILPSSFIYSAYRLGPGRGSFTSGLLMWSGADILMGGIGIGVRAEKQIKNHSSEQLKKNAPELHMGNILGLSNPKRDDYQQ